MRTWCLFVMLFMVHSVVSKRHVLTYVGFDHVLDFDPDSGTIRAFDFRRQLPTHDQCDFFVFPPLIENASFIDVMTQTMQPSEISTSLTYLGGENFLVADGETGAYTVRRCSGFMPQQRKIPCEVWASGRDDSFLNPYRYFFGGEGRVIRFHSGSQEFALVAYDADVHGGGYPFGRHSLLNATFSGFSMGDSVSFAYTSAKDNGANVDLLIAVSETSGQFKVWRYNRNARDSIEFLVGQLVMTGTLMPHFTIKTIGEDTVVAYNTQNGDFEIWKFKTRNGIFEIEAIKRDNIDNGHGCIFDTRHECLAHPTCGWCGDSLTCHQMNQRRSPCDSHRCLNWVDQFSTEAERMQDYETPNPDALKDFGWFPEVDPVSPLRRLNLDTAVPILRANDLDDEEILHGIKTNPSEGLNFRPPTVSNPEPCIDSKFVEHDDLPAPNVLKHVRLMNDVDGTQPDTIPTSPSGESQTSDCTHPIDASFDNKLPPNGFPSVPNGNVLVSGVQESGITGVAESSESAPKKTEESLFKAPEGLISGVPIPYQPSSAGSASEEDMMNSILSPHSTLIMNTQENNAAIPVPAPVPAPEDSFAVKIMTEYKPSEGKIQIVPPYNGPYEAPEPEPMTLYSPEQMEGGVADKSTITNAACAEANEPSRPSQNAAMTNSQFQSSGILNPYETPVELVSEEHHRDETGTDAPIRQLPPRPILDFHPAVVIPVSLEEHQVQGSSPIVISGEGALLP